MLSECAVWENVPSHVKPDTKVFIAFLPKSRADNTSKQRLEEIRKFLKWNVIAFGKVIIPIPVSMAAVYLYTRHDESKSYANVVAAHTTLKWFHTIEPYQIENPFDIPVCRNILETSKRMKLQPINKKTPITAEIIQKMVEKHAHLHTDLKGLRIACIRSLGPWV